MGIIIQIDGKNFDMDTLESDEMARGYMLALEGDEYKGADAPYSKLSLTVWDWWWLNECHKQDSVLTFALVESGIISSYGDSLEYLEPDNYTLDISIKKLADYGAYMFGRTYGDVTGSELMPYMNLEDYGADYYNSAEGNNHHLTSKGLLIED